MSAPISATEMVTIREEDLIASVADALQFISYYHPVDYIQALGKAYAAEQGPAAKDAIAQILTNSRMSAEGHRPICQDTGIVNVFIDWGQDCRLESKRSLQDVVDEGVRRAYNHPDNKLRASVLADPAFTRRNTRDNTPCVLTVTMVSGQQGLGGRRGQGRGQREQIQVQDDEPQRQYRRLGGRNAAADGGWLVSAGDAGDRDRRDG